MAEIDVKFMKLSREGAKALGSTYSKKKTDAKKKKASAPKKKTTK